MKKISLCLAVIVLALAPVSLRGEAVGVKGVKVILGQILPTGQPLSAVTDGNGVVHFRVAGPGRYVAQFAQPHGYSEIEVQGEVRPLTAGGAATPVGPVKCNPAASLCQVEVNTGGPSQVTLRHKGWNQKKNHASSAMQVRSPDTARPWPWPWRGQLTGTPVPGAQVGLIDDTRQIITAAAVRPDGTFELAAPRVAMQGAPRLCVLLRPGTQPLCGEPGNQEPTLRAPGVAIQMKAVTKNGGQGF